MDDNAHVIEFRAGVRKNRVSISSEGQTLEQLLILAGIDPTGVSVILMGKRICDLTTKAVDLFGSNCLTQVLVLGSSINAYSGRVVDSLPSSNAKRTVCDHEKAEMIRETENTSRVNLRLGDSDRQEFTCTVKYKDTRYSIHIFGADQTVHDLCKLLSECVGSSRFALICNGAKLDYNDASVLSSLPCKTFMLTHTAAFWTEKEKSLTLGRVVSDIEKICSQADLLLKQIKSGNVQARVELGTVRHELCNLKRSLLQFKSDETPVSDPPNTSYRELERKLEACITRIDSVTR